MKTTVGDTELELWAKETPKISIGFYKVRTTGPVPRDRQGKIDDPFGPGHPNRSRFLYADHFVPQRHRQLLRPRCFSRGFRVYQLTYSDTPDSLDTVTADRASSCFSSYCGQTVTPRGSFAGNVIDKRPG
ncbi:hypothetical protein WN48_01860 [Eufriesea mexicana]|nr:hypothetical protein WN48_01860 [Eufriesea mexicana]